MKCFVGFCTDVLLGKIMTINEDIFNKDKTNFYDMCVLNNSTEEQKTMVYDINGNATEMILKPLEIRWLNK